MSSLDWPSLMRLGVQGLGLRPDDFWRLTPAELRLMLGENARGGPMTKTGLDDLMASYPDTNTKDTPHDR
ncbi:MAG: rcc01693 family protein [Roseobacter sp.]